MVVLEFNRKSEGVYTPSKWNPVPFEQCQRTEAVRNSPERQASYEAWLAKTRYDPSNPPIAHGRNRIKVIEYDAATPSPRSTPEHLFSVSPLLRSVAAAIAGLAFFYGTMQPAYAPELQRNGLQAQQVYHASASKGLEHTLE